jgi:hypothetical protein
VTSIHENLGSGGRGQMYFSKFRGKANLLVFFFNENTKKCIFNENTKKDIFKNLGGKFPTS